MRIGPTRGRLDARRIVPLVLLGVVFAFYAWTAATSDELGLNRHLTDPYNEQATAFLHGHTALPIDVPPGLLALPDRFDPDANARYRVDYGLHDLILHDGKLYSYWGAAPAVVLFIPFRALGLGDLPPGIAVLLFSVVGLLLSLAILRFAITRWLPDTPPWMFGVAVVIVATGNLAPWILRRPIQYEVAISGAYCFAQAGLLLILTGALRDEPSWRRLGLGSLCCGLAFATRPPLGIVIVASVVVFVWWRRAGRLHPGPRTRRAALVLFGPFLALVVAVGLFNLVRFGSPTDFGIQEQLAGRKISEAKMDDLSYVLPGLWYYLLAPVRWNVQFPFVQLPSPPNPPFSLPDAYVRPAQTGGLLANVPILLMLLAAPLALRSRPRELAVVVWGMVASALVLMLFESLSLWTTHERYEMDFATFLLLPACLVWFALANAASADLGRRNLWAAGGTILAVYGTLVALGASMTGEQDRLRRGHADTFRSLESFFAPVAVGMTKLAGHPVIANIEGNVTAGDPGYGQLGVDGASAYLTSAAPLHFEVIAPSGETLVVRARMSRLDSGDPASPLLVRGATQVPGHQIDGAEQQFSIPGHKGRNKLMLQVAGPQAQVAVRDLRVGDH